MENQIWTLLARKFSGEATPEESRLLRKLMEEDPGLAEVVNNISADWYNPGSTETQKALASFSRLDAKIRQDLHPLSPAGDDEAFVDQPVVHPFRRRSVAFLKIAAVLILLCGAGVFLFREAVESPASPPMAGREIKAPAKNIREVKLADGSVVWLNEKSTIRLNDHFNRKQREVWLIGEAYFDVAKNRNVPFIIHAGKVNIRVLGTAFNVKSYPEGKSVETSLLKGSVEITLEDQPDAKYILKPNQKLVVPVAGNAGNAENEMEDNQKREKPGISFLALSKVPDGASGEIIAEVSWRERKLAFYETSFSELAELLENRFHVPIEFENEEMESLVFTGVFNKETLSQALHALSLSAAFRYRIEPDRIVIF